MAKSNNQIDQIQACITNPLDQKAIGGKKILGIIGDAPSQYAKSPPIWNTTFKHLKLSAVYVPLDTPLSRLKELVQSLKDSNQAMGANVTVPYKVKVLDYLDDLDEKAARINAVNTIVREKNGKLVGYNTDGSGFLESVLNPQFGEGRPFIESLAGMNVLMIGAGGSARAVAFSLAERIGSGSLLICNRTEKAAVSLAEDVSSVFGNARAIREREVPDGAPQMGLIINCSTRGQGGIRNLGDGGMTILEPYSALAPANPATFHTSDDADPVFYQNWLEASRADILANNKESMQVVATIPVNVKFCDLIYHPTETTFLRHGRLSGHKTLNGKGMNVAQAAEAFFHRICKSMLQARKLYNDKTYKKIISIMSSAW